MRKLNSPNYGPFDIFDCCVGEMPVEVAARYNSSLIHLQAAVTLYDQKTLTATWCDLPRAANGNDAQVIAGSLTKGDLTAAYTNGFVKSRHDARKIYDEIVVSAKGKCPYCGGIGDPRTLDHYLPKAKFPAFSLLPSNLVPCCRDCNTGMGSAFATQPDMQPVHPYLDALHFFEEKWIFATITLGDPVEVFFYVDPPSHWCEKDKSRVRQHFLECDLARRYAEQAPSELSPEIKKRHSSLKTLSKEVYRATLLDVANCEGLPLNGWKRALYSAMSETDWFCDGNFA